MKTTINDVLDTKLQAERGTFFKSIFESSNYLDVSTETLADQLTTQISRWEEYEARHSPQWTTDVKAQLADQTEDELADFYERIVDERMTDVRLQLSKIFSNHKQLSVRTTDHSDCFPTIELSVDNVYKDADDTYHVSSAVPQVSTEYWNHEFDCSWEDVLSYAEYD